ncbi:Peptidase A1 domain-containing protein [Mycena kentingensis (nom. inval.)]|nr:Peptidase A1 domain-containing protein [Mycena kentingensis (nom. inval.)]
MSSDDIILPDISAPPAPAIHMMELKPYKFNRKITQHESVRIDVERQQICRPSPECSGLFWDPDVGAARYFAGTNQSAAQNGAGRRFMGGKAAKEKRNRLTGTSDYHRHWENHQIGGAGTGATSKSAKLDPDSDADSMETTWNGPSERGVLGIANRGGWFSRLNPTAQEIDVNARLIYMTRTRGHATNSLHYAEVGVGMNDPNSVDDCLKILIDTGCGVTWLYSSTAMEATVKLTQLLGGTISATLAPTGSVLHRKGKTPRFYTGGAVEILNLGEDLLTYGDGFAVGLKYHKGPFFFVQTAHPEMSVWRSDDFIFGAAVQATVEPSNEEMDGILGMGIAPRQIVGVVPDLFVPKSSLNQGAKYTCFKDQRFTIALGDRGSPSVLLIGPNYHDVEPAKSKQRLPELEVIPNFGWTEWIRVTSPSDWAIPVYGVTIQGTLYPPTNHRFSMVLDTGSVYSYFPLAVFDELKRLLDIKFDAVGSPYCNDSNPNLDTEGIKLNFGDNFILEIPTLRGLLDYSQPPPQTAPGCVYCAFSRGIKYSATGELYILGNLLLRHLVVEFKHDDQDAFVPGLVRLARRDTTQAVRMTAPAWSTGPNPPTVV